MNGESSRNDTRSEPHSLQLLYLRSITNNFSDERLLGEGGFGKVYKVRLNHIYTFPILSNICNRECIQKPISISITELKQGVLPNGDMMAVKKLNLIMPGVEDKQFNNEAHHLMRLKHKNIVLLIGCCSETESTPAEYEGRLVWAEKTERLLCLEYMPKGSLDKYLSDESSGLDWATRYKIIEGICCGLHYLHEEWSANTPIIHMDLKPANILLDRDMVPKIADFGLARLFGEAKTRTCTKNCVGTLGYMAPEYINRGIITKKVDIFSLGVIIVAIVTGHPNEYPDDTGRSQEFINLVLGNWRNRLHQEQGYISLETSCQQITRCIQVALECVKPDRAKRPTISQIINMLRRFEYPLASAEWSNTTKNKAVLSPMSLFTVATMASKLKLHAAATKEAKDVGG